MVAPNNNGNFEINLDLVLKGEEAAQNALKGVTEEAQKAKESVKGVGDEIQGAGEKGDKALANLRLQMRALRAEAKEITTQVRLLRDTAQDIDRVAKPLFTGGAFVVGGIFAAANKYVNDAKEATSTTRAWKAAQDSLNQSGQRIGAVLAKEALPLLREAAQVTSQIASFIEKNPGVVSTALKGGLAALTLGAIGKAVSGGIKLYADLKLDTALALQADAATLQVQAARMQLEAAGIQSTANPGKVPSGGSGGNLLLGTIAAVGLVGEFKLLKETIGLGVNAGELYEKNLVKLGVLSETTAGKLDLLRSNVIKLYEKIPLLGSFFSGMAGQSASGLGTASGGVKAPTFLGGSQVNQDKAVADFKSFQNDIKQITADTEKERLMIIRDAEKEMASSTAKYSKDRVRLVNDINAQNAKAQADYNQFLTDSADERLGIVSDGEKRVQEIRANAQKELEKLEQSHNDRVGELTAARDALGLEKEKRDFNRAQRDISSGANEEIQKEKQQTRERLAEFDQRYALEKAQRLADLQQTIKDNAEKLKEFDAAHREEITRLREAETAKLKQLQESATAERIKRREQFVNELKDLGIYTNNDIALKKKGYDAMLLQTQQWVTNMQNTIKKLTASSLGTASGGVAVHDYTGYAYSQMYKMADNGQRQFVLSGPDTRAAERAIGGQLNQGNAAQMIAAFASMRNQNASVHYAPNYSQDVSARTRRDIEGGFRRTLQEVLDG